MNDDCCFVKKFYETKGSQFKFYELYISNIYLFIIIKW